MSCEERERACLRVATMSVHMVYTPSLLTHCPRHTPTPLYS